MKVKYTSGPKAGQEEHVSNEIGRVIVGTGLAEEVETSLFPKFGDFKIPEPKWAVLVTRGSEAVDNPNPVKMLVIEMRLADTIARFSGHPNIVNARREWQGGGVWLSGFGRECPKALVDEYRHEWERHPELRGEKYRPKVQMDGDPAKHEGPRTVNL